jgi:hypothetical protein
MAKRLPALFACAAIAVAIGGCGDDTRGVNLAQVRSVVHQFAKADDAKACELLSPNALVNVYGGFRKPVDESRAICERRSKNFEGEDVKVTDLNVIDPDTVRVTALSPKGDVTYFVGVRKFGPAWRVDEITQKKTRN